MEKIVVFAPMASASDATATKVDPGALRSIRAAYRKSAPSTSIQFRPSEPRISSLCLSVGPNAMRARREASSGETPDWTRSCVSSSRWNDTSDSIRSSRSSRLTKARSQERSDESARDMNDPTLIPTLMLPPAWRIECSRQSRPCDSILDGFACQPLAPGTRELVVVRLPVVLALAPFTGNHNLMLKPEKHGIQ